MKLGKWALTMVLVLMAALLCAAAGAEEAETFTSGYYTYRILEDGTAEITSCSAYAEQLDVPAELDGIAVTSIGEGAFSFDSVLTSVTLPDSVISIAANPFAGCSSLSSIQVSADHPSLSVMDGVLFSRPDRRLISYPGGLEYTGYSVPQGIECIGDNAFRKCESLTSITLPDSVTSIGSGAFGFCSSLTGITLPDSVTSIGANPFVGCKALKNIRVSPDHPSLSVIDGVLFSKSDERLIVYPHWSNNLAYAVPQGIRSIGDGAFWSCESLTSITLPDSVTSIGDDAFKFCESLTSITLPDSVTRIGNGVFEFCKSLTSITLPDNVTSIGNEAFYGCNSLTSITLPDRITSIGDGVFSHCYALTSITLPDSVTSIGANPFTSCDALKNIRVSPDHPALAVIDGVLFSKPDKRLVSYPCGLEYSEYTVPQGIKCIGDNAFCWCSSLTSITIPDGVTSIGDRAFLWCRSLTGVTLPDSVTSIGNRAFEMCDSLASITIPIGVTSVEDIPFADFSSLKNIRVSPDHPTLAVIDGVLFSKPDKKLVAYPRGLEYSEYTVPQGIKCIGDRAFCWCNSLTSITVPDSVTSIGYGAFGWSESLTSVTLSDGVTSIGDWAFELCESLTSVTIPASVTSIGRGAFRGCPNLTLTLPRDSYALQYAKDNDIPYTYPDVNDWLND